MVSTNFISAADLLVCAEREAASLGQERAGSGHLLIAILREDAGLAAELLRQEGLGEEELGAAVGDSEEAMKEIVRVAHQHAVLFECEEIGGDQLLLAVTVSKCRAGEALEERGARQLIHGAIVESLAGEADDPPLPLVPTAREALAIAWSNVLAIGRETIEIDDLLRGICAPGWTIGARATAALGRRPDWAPAPWTEGPPADPYRRIPFGEPAREALRLASQEAAQLRRADVGTEHLLLGICAAANEELAAFAGRQVDQAQVRDAVAKAVGSAEEARDAEARRGGWSPEQEQGESLGERLVTGAEEIAERSGEAGSGAGPGCWPGFLAAILLNEDEGLTELLDEMELDPAEIYRQAKGEDDLPLVDAIALAEDRRRDAELEPLDLVLATVAVGSPRVLAALDRIGLTGAEVRAQLSEWRLRQEGDTSGAASVLATAALNLLLGAVTTVALVQAVASQGAWWKLVFLTLVWAGYPGKGPFGNAVAAAVLGIAVSPLVGVLHLLGIPGEVAQARAERQAIWSRTGVHLNLRELRCVTRRQIGWMGQLNQGGRQIVRSLLPAWLRRGSR